MAAARLFFVCFALGQPQPLLLLAPRYLPQPHLWQEKYHIKHQREAVHPWQTDVPKKSILAIQ